MCRLLLRQGLPLAVIVCRLACCQDIPQSSVPGSSQPDSNAKHYAISGTVLNSVTNEPIRRALVRVNGRQEQYVVFTGADGRFQLSNVSEGPVWISAQRPGFFDPAAVSSSPFPRANAGYKVGSGSNDFRILLIPESTLAGAVLDGDGEPIEEVQVQVLGEQITNGRKMWINRGSTITDDNGVYRLGEQLPGRVIVCTSAKPLAPNASGNSPTYPPRCYPDSADVASAQIIDVVPGQETRTNFKLSPVRSFAVHGTVSNLERNSGANIWVEGVGGTPAAFGYARMNPNNGHFTISSVPDGSWRIHFQINDGQGKTLEAVENIVVNGSDLVGLKVTLEPSLNIPIQVNRMAPASVEANGAGRILGGPQMLQVRLVSTDSQSTQQYYSSPLPNEGGATGSIPLMALAGVQPGTYNVFPQLGGAACLASVSYGGSDLTREPLTIAPGAPAQPIIVNLRNDCASLSVTTHSDSSNPGGLLLVLADLASIEPQIVSLDANASVNVPNLTPGVYHVYALSDLDGLEYANPQAMRDFPSETVDLQPNQKASITVELINRRRQ